jgi:hypothetical protein
MAGPPQSAKPDGKAFRRILWICCGVLFIVLGLIGWSPGPTPLPLWRRAIGVAGGIFFIYVGSMYYFPKNRKRRDELNKSKRG